MTDRRFPPSWTVEELDARFVVRDRNGQKLANGYFEDEPGRRAAAKLLTQDEARRIAVNIAKLSELSKPACILKANPERGQYPLHNCGKANESYKNFKQVSEPRIAYKPVD